MFKGFVSEFKQFISRGNVLDMAVGIIMGTAFTAIVTSLVQGVFMPMIGFFINGINFSDLRIILAPATGENAEVAIMYGAFIQQIINFLIIALVVFFIVKIMNKLQKKKEQTPAAPPQPSEEIVLLREIRDLLAKK